MDGYAAGNFSARALTELAGEVNTGSLQTMRPNNDLERDPLDQELLLPIVPKQLRAPSAFSLRLELFPDYRWKRLGTTKRLGVDLILRVLFDKGAGGECQLGVSPTTTEPWPRIWQATCLPNVFDSEAAAVSSSTRRGSSQVGMPPPKMLPWE